MATVRAHLRNAPIMEGLIDIRVSSQASFEDGQLQEIAGATPGYQKQGLMHEIETDLILNGQARSAKTRTTGIRLRSVDEKYIAQFTSGGFTLSRLPPYQTWDGLVSETMRLWQIYLELAKPALVTRVATRFINNLQLPMRDGEHFEEYLTAPPQVPPGLPQSILGFLQRVVVANPQIGAHANIIQVLQDGFYKDRIPVILDIDVYRSSEFSPSSSDIWESLATLRDFKNTIFFASLKEKAVELYA